MTEQANKYRVSTFITCIESDALLVYNGLPFEEDDKNKISKVIEFMERYCSSQTNVIYERGRRVD